MVGPTHEEAPGEATRLEIPKEKQLLTAAPANTSREGRPGTTTGIQKKIVSLINEIKAVVPEATVEVWAQDEARLGLKPTTRRVWAPKGQRPVATQHIGYEWLYLYGFVRPHTGDVEWLLLPTVNIDTFNIALAHFAQAVGASENKRIVLVIDGAGWHRSGDVDWPVGIHPLFLPPYSPELQPAEKLWPLVREAHANRLIRTLDELEEILVHRCSQLIQQPELIRGCSKMLWWPDA